MQVTLVDVGVVSSLVAYIVGYQLVLGKRLFSGTRESCSTTIKEGDYIEFRNLEVGQLWSGVVEAVDHIYVRVQSPSRCSYMFNPITGTLLYHSRGDQVILDHRESQ